MKIIKKFKGEYHLNVGGHSDVMSTLHEVINYYNTCVCFMANRTARKELLPITRILRRFIKNELKSTPTQ